MKTIIFLLSIIAFGACFQNFSVPDNTTATLLLNLHNIERTAVGVYNLTWSPSLAQASQDWANFLASKNAFYHSGTGWVGENIAKATFRNNLTTALFTLWSSQKQYFNPTVKYGANSSTDPKKEVGHYTQIIWSMSYEVGCGIANTSSSGILVCQYRYAGNYLNEWVFKPDSENPWVAAKPVVNPAALAAPPAANSYPNVLDNATSTLILNLHNTERTFVGMKNLTWSETLAVSAQAHANKQAQASTFKLSGTKGVGENMQLATIRPNIILYMIGLWINERVNFDATLRYPKCAINNKMISHYTQMVWSASYELGCGFATNTKNGILVCQYRLGGNYIGNYVVYPAPTTNFNFTPFSATNSA